MDNNLKDIVFQSECKFCLQEDKIINLASPCKCDGSMKYVHLNCLNMYHKKKYLDHCDICKQKYLYDNSIDKSKHKSLFIIYSICLLNNFFSTLITFDLDSFYILMFIIYMLAYYNLFISNKLYSVDIITNNKISNPSEHHYTYELLNNMYNKHIKFCCAYTFTYKFLHIFQLLPNDIIKNFYKVLYLFVLLFSIIKLNKKVIELSNIKIIKSLTNKNI